MSEYTQPALLKRSVELLPLLKAMAPQDLAKLMGISDKLAVLNVRRFAEWHLPFTTENAKQAVYLFDGDVYEGLHANTLPESAIHYLQQHLGILSGLYGILRPLDLIQPYRLEMGTKLANDRGANLYDFWGDQISSMLKKMMAQAHDEVLVNLASHEYFKSVRVGALPCSVITPIFKDYKNGQYKIISFYAKRARGLMVRYAAEHALTEANALKDFAEEGYHYDAASSSEREWVFLREEHHK